MATKERQASLGRRQQTASPSPKDQVTKNETITDAQKLAASKSSSKATTKTPLVRKLAKGPTKKNQKKLALKINSRAKRKNTKKITRSLINTAKKLLNGKISQKKVKQEVDEDPPVLEPIFTIEDNLDKKPTKRSYVRKKIKVEPEDAALNSDSSASSVKNTKKTKANIKTESVDSVLDTIECVISSFKNSEKTEIKTKIECPDSVSEVIECVINEFTLSPDEIKREPDSMSESSKSDIVIKPKKLTKKQKLNLLQAEVKKENIENSSMNIAHSNQKVIDMLDLNVLKVKKPFSTGKRRHTIEKYSNLSDNQEFPPLKSFPSLPCNNPKPKRKLRVINPYSTRPPARLLRNGKQRQLKNKLSEGLDDAKKKKRIADLLELSRRAVDYESESSLSDRDVKDIEVKKELIDSGASDVPMEIERRLSMDAQVYCTDTNSNVCKENETIVNDFNVDIYPSPSAKVPEKLLILDIMKQNFNEPLGDSESSTTLKTTTATIEITNALSPVKPEEKETDDKMSEIISKIVETMGSEEFTATIDTTGEGTALVVQNGESIEDVAMIDSAQQPEPTQPTISSSILPDNLENIAEVANTNGTESIPFREEQEKELEKEETVEEKGSELIDEGAKEIVEEEQEQIPEEVVVEKKAEDALEEEVDMDIEKEEEKYLGKENEELITEEKSQVLEDSLEEKLLLEEEPRVQPETNSSQVTEEESSMEILEPTPSTSGYVKHVDSIHETEEETAIKENMFKALGLQSLKAAQEAKTKVKDDSPPKVEMYTGTLKTVIKLNRDNKKKGKNHPLRMTLQKSKSKGGDGAAGNQDDYKIMKEGCSTWKHGNQSSDTAGAHRKTHYYNRSNPDGSSEHTSDGEIPNAEGPVKALVIPEKASSFSIHPERLCKDECTYCFGKFGLFDTPCHIAQIKSVERQDKILSTEKHLMRDSCLCDACYRHIDRKANTPSYVSKSFKRGPLVAPGPRENHCHVLACRNISANVLRRKWIIKMKKQICEVINIDLDNPGLHSIPICDDHYRALEHLMVCAMCKRRLAKNHIHYIGPEVEDLNTALQEKDIPLKLADKPVVCKLCKCFATVILKNLEDYSENTSNFLTEYRKRLLHFNNIVPMNEAEAEEPIMAPAKDRADKEPPRKKRKLSKNNSDDNSRPESPANDDKSTRNQSQNEQNCSSRPDSPSDYLVDYNSLIPSIALECDDSEPTAVNNNNNRNAKTLPNLESIKNSSDKNSNLTVQRLGSNPSLSVRQLFPGEEDLGLHGSIDFGNVKEKTPEGWEKCKMTIQYDKSTKQLWQDLQKPYGNHSSFLRHLILLEKYFRNGDLELKSNSSQQSINYSESVQNRLRAYDNVPTGVAKPLPPSTQQKSSSGIITSCIKEKPLVPLQTIVPGLPVMTTPNVSVTTVRPSPVTITQINNNPIIPISINKAKPPPPPGLISLLPGTNRPVAPLVKPPSKKIKFPITKNWRPTLIPIDPTKPSEKKTGLVQVISGGKPFHITLDDYKKMCAIKRTFEMREQRLQERKMVSVLRDQGLMVARIKPKFEQEPEEAVMEREELNEKKTLLNIPKIPKSLTVIQQTVPRKPSGRTSPVMLITQKPNPNAVSNKS